MALQYDYTIIKCRQNATYIYMFLEVLDIIIKTLDAQNIYCNKSINSQPQHKLQNLNLASYKHTHTLKQPETTRATTK